MELSLINEIKLLAKHSAVYTLGNFMQRVVALALLPVYTRFLSPYDYGVKELVGLTTDVIAILLATAISGAFYRFYFQYDSMEDRREVLSTSLLAIGAAGLIAVALLSLSAPMLAGLALDNAGLKHFFIISFSGLWFQTLNGIGYNYLKANKKSVHFILLSFMKMVGTIGLNIYFICFLKIGVLGILLSNLIAAVGISAVLTFPLLYRSGIRFSRDKLFAMLRFGLPLIPSQLGAFVVHLSDRFFIKEYCSIADAGLYSLGYRLGALPGHFISDPFNQIFQPRRLEVYQKPDSERIFGRIFTYFLSLMLFVGLMISVLSREVLMIMADEKFWSAYQVVPLIVLATTIFSFHYHLNMGIVITKKTKYLAYVNFSNGVLVLCLNFLMIPRYGVFGAALATLVAFIYKAALTYYFSSRFFRIHFEFVRIVKLMVSAATVYWGVQAVSIDSVYLSFAVRLAIIITTYPAVLWLLRFFTKQETRKVMHIFGKRSSAAASM